MFAVVSKALRLWTLALAQMRLFALAGMRAADLLASEAGPFRATGESAVGVDHGFRLASRMLAEGHQRRLVVDQKSEQACEEARLVGRLPQSIGRQAGQCEKARHQFRLAGEPAKNLDRDVFGFDQFGFRWMMCVAIVPGYYRFFNKVPLGLHRIGMAARRSKEPSANGLARRQSVPVRGPRCRNA